MNVSIRTFKKPLDKSSVLYALFAMLKKKKPPLDDRNHTDLYGSHASAFAMFKNKEDRDAITALLQSGQSSEETATEELKIKILEAAE